MAPPRCDAMGRVSWSALACAALLLALVQTARGALAHGDQTKRAVWTVSYKRSLGLRGGGAMELEPRRKPFEENTAAPDVILRDVMKKEKQPPTALESLLAEALFKMSADDSTKMLKYLHIMSAREVTVTETGERALVVFVPYTEMVSYRKMCPALTEALEDKLKAHVFLVAHRRILRKERRGKALYKQKRPMSRTISKVHEGYLEDIIWPGDVVAEKTTYAVNVKTPVKHIYLDPAERAVTEAKMPAYRAAYENLTGKKVVFEYLVYERSSELVMQQPRT